MSVTSFSRLGTSNAYDSTIANLQNRQNTLSNVQESLSSGKKVNTPSDDPTAAAQAERALNRLSRIATDQRALEVQRNSIASAESTLGDITDAMQQVRELVVNAGSGTLAAADRKTIANQITGLRQHILSLANTLDSNGQPLFGALGSALTPFAGPATAPDYAFNGLPGTAAGATYAIASALDGDSAFMLQAARDGVYNVKVGSASGTLSTGNISKTNSALINGSSYSIQVTGFAANTVTYSITETPVTGAPTTTAGVTAPWTAAGGFNVTTMPGLSLTVNGTPAAGDTVTVDPNSSVFATLDHAVTDLSAANNSTAATQAVSQALNNIDISMARISAVRGQAGDLLNRADSISSTNDKRTIEQTANKSRAEDVDMVQAISDFQKQQTGYQAALQSYAQIQKLSLFNYIS
ncbi:flagellar hook-associated protein 3 [Rhodoferax lacus]|uniref:Flagellar hook-associated protein 3 n=1 Tax=Rhodoferax lacus TaxID=2184758 RepID=A0A3E1R6Q8_9BURK|nr:flagellar hook-associated protein FlgL [Rhodoferax lacus]RFO95055.1 flagellar hook-associated protein 3 [Rhodoferax lacus]